MLYNPHGGRGKTCMRDTAVHVKQNKSKLSKNCHPHNTIIGSGYISYERRFDEWWDEQNRCTYVYDVKTQKQQVRGTPCKCCSRSQQRSSPGLRLRLTPLLVFIERVCMVNITFSHHFFCSWYIPGYSVWQSTFHTPVEEVAGPRDIFVK